jgi:hypothetical protein
MMKFGFKRVRFALYQFSEASVVGVKLFRAAASELKHGKTALWSFPSLVVSQNSGAVPKLFTVPLKKYRSIHTENDEKRVNLLYPRCQ